MSKASKENEIRNMVFEIIVPTLAEELGTDGMQVSASEFTFPILDREGNEIFANVKVTIPRGSRCDGAFEPYDGYAMAEDWQFVNAERQRKKEQVEKKKAEAEAERERKRRAKKALKTMKAELAEVLPTQVK